MDAKHNDRGHRIQNNEDCSEMDRSHLLQRQNKKKPHIVAVEDRGHFLQEQKHWRRS